MIPQITAYAQQRGLSEQDATQTFLQVLVLKHLPLDVGRLIGGTALVLGQANPRFSEDLDLGAVQNHRVIGDYLARAGKEIATWLQGTTSVVAPTGKTRTWRLRCVLPHGRVLRLHVDSQSYRTYTQAPIVITYPGFAPSTFPSVRVTEMMADKLIALAFRKYLSGRDLFDLWFHWWRGAAAAIAPTEVLTLLAAKLKERTQRMATWRQHIRRRVASGVSERCRQEWDRYLPAGLHTEAVYREIITAAQQRVKQL